MLDSQKPAIVQKAIKNAEDQLAEHLNKAEYHLIEAVKLFSGPHKISRRVGYSQKLTLAQEAITTLYREELVRIRGPIKMSIKKRKK